MRTLTSILTVMGICAVCSSAVAQFDQFSLPPAVTPAWQQFKLNPSTRVSLDFRNASSDAIIETLSRASGIAILKDPSLTSAMTLQSPKPQTL
ncbi:MAG TPA: hypothetical protein VGS41_14870, partial [Chthonomonadales bacterium]|nr:hypothetical protein [Chthonomonadales bacterium]